MSSSPPTLTVGFGKADMSAFEPEMTMFGWGDRRNRARGVHTPLHARAVVIRSAHEDETLAFVAIEALIVGQGLWQTVLDTLAATPSLGLSARNVVLVATHTHSGPSGYGHHFWEAFNAPGFSPPVFSALHDAIINAIREAADNLVPAHASLAVGTVPLAEGIAWNRSWFAYNRNPDVTPVSKARRDEATDRTVTALRFHAPDSGQVLGLVHWFATHGTAVHADNDQLHPDHKGLLAQALEADGLGVVCAQECCGDVSPNFRWDPRRKHNQGRFDDDLASAAHVADAQLRATRALLSAPGTALSPTLQVATRFLELGHAPVDPRFSPDGRTRSTRPAVLGISMAQGTAEGPGPLREHRWLPRALNGLVGLADRARGLVGAERRHDPKFPFLQLARGAEGKLAGVLPLGLTPPVDPTFRWVRDAVKNGGVHAGSWVPETVPLQLVKLGELVIAASPFEMTTVSGRRLRKTLMDAFSAAGTPIAHVVMSPYANAYVGYLTTFEEYQAQHYEAAYTLFGPFSLGAVQTAFSALVSELGAKAARTAALGVPPRRAPSDHLERIRFSTPWPD